MLVRMALKSVALSFVNSRAVTFRPFSFATFSTTSARPWPYAVRSSMIAMVLAFSAVAA